MITIRGKVVDGVGQGAHFASLNWVKEQCQEKLGFQPWPGTLNLEVLEEDISLLGQLEKKKSVTIIPPTPNFCEGRCIRVQIGGISAAVVIPEEQVRIHGKRIIEILAPVKLKDALGIKNNDVVTLVIG
jgi:CTP-dependent riboflavin kinase